MTDLQTALDYYDATGMLEVKTEALVEAARLVADLDTAQLEAVKHALETYDLTLTKHESIRFLAHGAQKWVDLAAALTPGDTKVICGAWGGCPLPRGHNMGKMDIPANHGSAALTPGDTE